MAVKTDTLIEYFSDKLGLNPKTLSRYLNQRQTEYYNLEYYLAIAYYWHRISYGTIRELFLSYVRRKMDIAVDIGCGCGLYSQLVLERAREYIGVDSSRSAIELAKKIYENRLDMKFVCEDAVNMKGEENSIDLIFCTEVIEHINDNVPLFDNFHKLLRKGGMLFLTTTTYYYYIGQLFTSYIYKDIVRRRDYQQFLNRLRLYFYGFGGAEQRTRFIREGLEREDHVHAFTFKQLKVLLDDTNFKIMNYDYFNCKDIFYGLKSFPINALLRRVFHTSKVYGPNIALILSPT